VTVSTSDAVTESRSVITSNAACVCGAVQESLPDTSATVYKRHQSMGQYLCKDSVTKAEVVWLLQTVAKHHSLRSCDDTKDLFQAMFPDSNIAQQFTLGRTKAAYTIVYGLAPYFQSALTDIVSQCDVFVT